MILTDRILANNSQYVSNGKILAAKKYLVANPAIKSGGGTISEAQIDEILEQVKTSEMVSVTNEGYSKLAKIYTVNMEQLVDADLFDWVEENVCYTCKKVMEGEHGLIAFFNEDEIAAVIRPLGRTVQSCTPEKTKTDQEESYAHCLLEIGAFFAKIDTAIHDNVRRAVHSHNPDAYRAEAMDIRDKLRDALEAIRVVQRKSERKGGD